MRCLIKYLLIKKSTCVLTGKNINSLIANQFNSAAIFHYVNLFWDKMHNNLLLDSEKQESKFSACVETFSLIDYKCRSISLYKQVFTYPQSPNKGV